MNKKQVVEIASGSVKNAEAKMSRLTDEEREKLLNAIFAYITEKRSEK